MAAILDRVFVVDVEATCWETREEQGDRPNEIIEIGICELIVKTGEIQNVSSYVVKPRFTTVSPFCTQLTGWTQEAVDEGADIVATLVAITEDYGLTKDHIWFSCGEYDRVKLGCGGQGSLRDLYGISSSQSLFDQMRHVNIKTLFALKYKMKREKGMEGMLAMINEKLEGRHHNGADDAANIAKIVRKVLS
jgi:inhibitor of KinA sporulation pathway (predicted exonuclease)